MTTEQIGIISIIKSALTGESYALPEDFDIEKAAKIARKHQISAIFYYGALKCGVSDSLPVMQMLFMETCKLMSISERQMYSINKIFEAFDRENIDYMPLKGTLLKRLYPKSEMRIMGDADILIKVSQYDRIKPVMSELGFEEKLESDHELVWTNSSIMIELHKHLIPSYNKDYYSYFGDGWKLGTPISEDATRYSMSPEDEMIYLFTHFAKHYRDAGIGIKHIVDLWVFRKNNNFNTDYLYTELQKLQLLEFYKNIEATLDVWFEGAETNETTDFITQIIFSSGVFGTHEAHLLSDAVKKTKNTGDADKTRKRKILHMIFMPYDSMCTKYPLLKRIPVLLPVMWVVRWVEVLLFRRKNITKQVNDIQTISSDKINGYQDSLHFVGLDFNFEE